MTDIIFRPATPPPMAEEQSIREKIGWGPKIEEKVMDKSTTEPPMSVYEKIKNQPYTKEFFKIADDILPIVSNEIKVLENFVKKEISLRNWEDRLDSYKGIVKELSDYLRISDNETSVSKVKKLATYISILLRSRKVESLKRKIEEEIRGDQTNS